MAGIFYKNSEYNEAISRLKKAIVTFRELDDKMALAGTYQNLGHLYRDCLGNYKKAIEVCEESVHIREHIGDFRGLASIYSLLAKLKLDLKMYNQAIELFNKSIQMCMQMNNKLILTVNISHLAMVYLKTGNLKLALNNVKKALKLSEEINSKENEIRALITYAEISALKKKWIQSSKLLEDAIKIARQMKIFPLLCEAYQKYGEMEKNRGNMQKAKRYMSYALNISKTKKIYALKKVIKKQVRELI
jgi:tetratricopeptide (TPR) repeat protein